MTSVASRETDRWAGKLHLEIQPTDACWVSAIADGRQGVQRLMAAGEHETIDATDEVMLRIGDPSTCVYSINGTAARQAGKAREPVTLHITRQNYRDFLNPAVSAAASGAPPSRPSTPLAVNGPSPAAPIPEEPVTARRLRPRKTDACATIRDEVPDLGLQLSSERLPTAAVLRAESGAGATSVTPRM